MEVNQFPFLSARGLSRRARRPALGASPLPVRLVSLVLLGLLAALVAGLDSPSKLLGVAPSAAA